MKPGTRKALVALWERPFQVALALLTIFVGIGRIALVPYPVAEVPQVIPATLVQFYGGFLFASGVLWLWSVATARWAVERTALTLLAGSYATFLVIELTLTFAYDLGALLVEDMIPQALLMVAAIARITYLGYLAHRVADWAHDHGGFPYDRRKGLR